MDKKKIKEEFIDYLGFTFIIHVTLWVMLTPWLFLGIQYTWEQYMTWLWQAPLVALASNYPLGKIIMWFMPRYRRRMGLDK